MDGEDKVSGEADWVVKDDFGEDCGVSAAEVDAVEAFLAAVV
jgi:hypothetical protein